MNLQTSVNILQNRDWAQVYKSSSCCIYNFADQYLIAPAKSIGSIPSGTLDTIFRSAYVPRSATCKGPCSRKSPLPALPIVLEKQGNQLWGRVELKGLLALAYGATREAIAAKLSTQLTEFVNYMHVHEYDTHALPDHYVFDYHYDLTCVRELFQQFKINHLAEQTNIPQDLLSQFMTNKQHPSTQQAEQIELLIQQFGREMLNFSLL